MPTKQKCAPLIAAIITYIIVFASVIANASAEFSISGSDTISQSSSSVKLRALYGDNDVAADSVWYIVSGGAHANINSVGLLTPLSNGTVVVSASYTDEEGAQHFATKSITITDMPTAVSEANVSISTVSVGQIILNKGSEDERKLYSGINGKYPVGTKFRLTAEETSCDFLFWKDVRSSKIITTDKTCELTLGTDISVHAVFRSTGSQKNHVIFTDENGYIFQNEVVGSANIRAPQSPSIPGHKFSAWLLNGEPQVLSGNTVDVSTVNEDRIYIASYTTLNPTYTVSVTGGSGSGSYKYNDSVSVTLDKSVIPDKMSFSCWARDGKAVSYDEVYTFRVSGNTSIYAVYSATASSQKAPLITMCSPYISGSDVTFISERSLPLDCELVETGILVSMSSNFDINTFGISRVVSQSSSLGGQFSVRKKNAASGNPLYAKAYLIYTQDSIAHTIYSNSVNVTI